MVIMGMLNLQKPVARNQSCTAGSVRLNDLLTKYFHAGSLFINVGILDSGRQN